MNENIPYIPTNKDVRSIKEKELNRLKTEHYRQLMEERLRFYEPYRQQMDFHKAQQEIRGLFGANKTGKSLCGTVEMLWTVGRVHPYRPNILTPGGLYGRDCCVDHRTLRETLIPIYQHYIPRAQCILPGLTYEGKKRIWPGVEGGSWSSAFSDQDKVLYLKDGSKIEFMSYEQDVTAFDGPVRHAIRMDEEPPENIFRANLARFITTDIRVWFTLTPIEPSEWLYNLLAEGSVAKPNKVFLVEIDISDSPYTTQNVVDTLEELYTDDAEKAARLHGTPTYKEGRVWKTYGTHNKIPYKTLPSNWERTIIIDPHPERPAAVNWIAKDFEGYSYVYREADIPGDVEEKCKIIKDLSKGERITKVLIDESAKASAEIRGKGKLIDDFRKYLPGWTIFMCSNRDQETDRETVRRAMKDDSGVGARLYVMDNCPITDFQIKNYSYKGKTKTGEDRGKAQVIKRNEDHCQCIMYFYQWESPFDNIGNTSQPSFATSPYGSDSEYSQPNFVSN